METWIPNRQNEQWDQGSVWDKKGENTAQKKGSEVLSLR